LRNRLPPNDPCYEKASEQSPKLLGRVFVSTLREVGASARYKVIENLAGTRAVFAVGVTFERLSRPVNKSVRYTCVMVIKVMSLRNQVDPEVTATCHFAV
jgi:hypothetical protein